MGRELLATIDDDYIAGLADEIERLPGYEGIPTPDLQAAAALTIRGFVQAILIDSSDARKLVAAVADTASDRAASGVPIDSFLQGWSIATRRLWHSTTDIAGRIGAASTDLAEVGTQLVDISNAITMQAAAAYRENELRADEERRQIPDRLLYELLIAGSREHLHRIADFGLDAARPLFAVRALHDADSPMPLDRWFSRCVTGTIGGESVAVAQDAPTTWVNGRAIIACGPSVVREELPRSFVLTGYVLAAARRAGRTGIVRLEELGARVAVAAEPDVSAYHVQRFVEPLRGAGAFGMLLEQTMRVYLANSLRLEATADALFIHRNTLRYRLSRIEGLTGTDLRHIDDIVGFWWALEAAPPQDDN